MQQRHDLLERMDEIWFFHKESLTHRITKHRYDRATGEIGLPTVSCRARQDRRFSRRAPVPVFCRGEMAPRVAGSFLKQITAILAMVWGRHPPPGSGWNGSVEHE
jgi:hypothetical protein